MNFVYYGHKADQVNPALDGVRECAMERETPWGVETNSSTEKRMLVVWEA